jgi:hypothetical protein
MKLSDISNVNELIGKLRAIKAAKEGLIHRNVDSVRLQPFGILTGEVYLKLEFHQKMIEVMLDKERNRIERELKRLGVNLA